MEYSIGENCFFGNDLGIFLFFNHERHERHEKERLQILAHGKGETRQFIQAGQFPTGQLVIVIVIDYEDDDDDDELTGGELPRR